MTGVDQTLHPKKRRVNAGDSAIVRAGTSYAVADNEGQRSKKTIHARNKDIRN
jgi:hypothetical protein